MRKTQNIVVFIIYMLLLQRLFEKYCVTLKTKARTINDPNQEEIFI